MHERRERGIKFTVWPDANILLSLSVESIRALERVYAFFRASYLLCSRGKRLNLEV